MTKRRQQILKMLEKQPADSFLIYGLAIEQKNEKELPAAIETLAKVIEIDPGYCYAYFQQGQIHEMLGDTTAARAAYERGIVAAAKKGDDHARQELQGALAALT